MNGSPTPQSPSNLPMKPLSKWVFAAVAAGILVVTAGLITLLWLTVATGNTNPAQASTQLEALRIGLSIALGGGGMFALYLGWRRQRSTEISLLQKQQEQALQERSAEDTRTDAVARRIADLHAKAADQLGSDKAAVRLAGLYTLERLAQDNPDQRPTVVKLLCAYLRMPYQPPDNEATALNRDATQERHVRIAAQRILYDHLFVGLDRDQRRPEFWKSVKLDLRGATLIDFRLSKCSVERATFENATFVGETNFMFTEFGKITFESATFNGSVTFECATFSDVAFFTSTVFQIANFSETNFEHDAYFKEASFSDSDFGSAKFSYTANFESATFSKNPFFEALTFAGHPWWSPADPILPAYTSFRDAQFKHGVPPAVRRFFEPPPKIDAGNHRRPIETRLPVRPQRRSGTGPAVT